jgi:hypothetical protein
LWCYIMYRGIVSSDQGGQVRWLYGAVQRALHPYEAPSKFGHLTRMLPAH